MSGTVFVQSSSGAITKMDVPTNPHALERFEAAIASQALRLVDPDDVEEVESRWGGIVYRLREGAVVSAPAPADDSVNDGEATAPTKQELLDQAKELGISATSRWSVKRLQAEIDAATSDAGGDDGED